LQKKQYYNSCLRTVYRPSHSERGRTVANAMIGPLRLIVWCPVFSKSVGLPIDYRSWNCQ